MKTIVLLVAVGLAAVAVAAVPFWFPSATLTLTIPEKPEYKKVYQSQSMSSCLRVKSNVESGFTEEDFKTFRLTCTRSYGWNN